MKTKFFKTSCLSVALLVIPLFATSLALAGSCEDLFWGVNSSKGKAISLSREFIEADGAKLADYGWVGKSAKTGSFILAKSNPAKVVFVEASETNRGNVVNPAVHRILVGRELTKQEVELLGREPYSPYYGHPSGWVLTQPTSEVLAQSIRNDLKGAMNAASSAMGLFGELRGSFILGAQVLTKTDGSKVLVVGLSLEAGKTPEGYLDLVLNHLKQ